MKRFLTYTTLFLCFCVLFISFYSCFGGAPRNDNKEKEVSLEGVSFKYPRSWTEETEVLGTGAYYVKVENRDDTFIMSFLTKEDSPEEMIGSYLETIQNSEVDVTITRKVAKGIFSKYEGLQAKYEMTYAGSKFYGEVTSFITNGTTVLAVKQTDTEKRLQNNFKMIEESFEVEGK